MKKMLPVQFEDSEIDEIRAQAAAEGRSLQDYDAGLLASAVARPQSSVFGQDAYPGVWEKAAALMESLGRNHALVDGNKQLAWTAT